MTCPAECWRCGSGCRGPSDPAPGMLAVGLNRLLPHPLRFEHLALSLPTCVDMGNRTARSLAVRSANCEKMRAGSVEHFRVVRKIALQQNQRVQHSALSLTLMPQFTGGEGGEVAKLLVRQALRVALQNRAGLPRSGRFPPGSAPGVWTPRGRQPWLSGQPGLCSRIGWIAGKRDRYYRVPKSGHSWPSDPGAMAFHFRN